MISLASIYVLLQTKWLGIEFESYEEASSEHGGGDASNPEEDIDFSDSLPLDSGEDMCKYQHLFIAPVAAFFRIV